PALQVSGSSSRAQVCGGTLKGGNSSPSSLGGSPAVNVAGGTLELRVTSQPLVLNGGSNPANGVPALTIDAGASVSIDPVVQLVPSKSFSNSGPPAITGGGSYGFAAMPAVTTVGASLGSTLGATLTCPGGDAYALFLGLPQAPLPTSFGM